MTALDQAVLATLTYSDHFGFPLTFKEIFFRLVRARSSRPLLRLTLSRLLQSGQIRQTGLYYFLPGRADLVALRHRRRRTSSPKLARARVLAARLARFPGVLAIFATGTLAVANTKPSDDLDLMIITQSNRLWTTRLLLTVYCQLFGLRRTPHSTSHSGKLCLNLYLDPSGFLLPASRQNLYTAYELIQALPLYDPHHTRSALLFANPWVRDFLPNLSFPKAQPHTPYAIRHTPYAKIFEKLAYWVQKKYMSKRITREYIAPHSAFFHPRDPSKQILKHLNIKELIIQSKF